MAVEIVRGANFWDIDANGAGRVVLYGPTGTPAVVDAGGLAPAFPAGLPPMLENDGTWRNARGGVTGGQSLDRIMALFQDMVDGAAVNTQLWTQALTTMTVTQATRQVTMNAGNSVATAVNAIHTSLRQFQKPKGATLRFSSRCRFNWTSSNCVMEVGFCNPTGSTGQVPNGAFLRVTSAGTIELVFSYNNVDLATVQVGQMGTNPATDVVATSWYDIDIWLSDMSVHCVVQRANGATGHEEPVIDAGLAFSVGQIAEWQAIASPVAFRIYNGGVGPTTASNLLYSGVQVWRYDHDAVKPYGEQLAAAGRGVALNPASGAQLANYANSAAPASATLSNTAAGYTTLGGQWQFAAVAGAETDYALFAFAVPTGRALHVKGIRIDAWVMGAAVATTPTILQWGIDRASAATLASNSFRKVIGAQTLAIGAAPGTMADKTVAWEEESSAFVVDSGQTFHIILKMPVATATASSIIRGTAVVAGYFE